MKDPSATAAWVDSTVFELHVQQAIKRNSSMFPPLDSLNMPSGWEVACSMNLMQFRSLPSKAIVVLFTPIIMPANMTKADISINGNGDPFEPLGRALSRHRNKIRHIPYIVHVGFTENHRVFMNQADAVVVVTCEANDAAADRNLAQQEIFAESVVDALNVDRVQADRVALAWMRFGGQKDRRDIPAYENVLRCGPYDNELARKGAGVLFGVLE